MDVRDSDTRQLLAVLTRCRTECLTMYTAQMYAQGCPFINDDRLITQVRGGAFYDALYAYIQDGNVDKFTTFIEGTAHQLTSGGYSYDQIKRMYNLLGQTIMTVVRRELIGMPNFDGAVRTLNFGLQLVQVATLTHSSTQLLQRMSASQRTEPFVTPAPSPTTYTGFTPRPSNAPLRSGSNGSNGANNLTALPGMLVWPLVLVVKNHPPEYAARLDDGTEVNVLLVDDPSVYIARGRSSDTGIRCTIRRIGPITLAYPL